MHLSAPLALCLAAGLAVAEPGSPALVRVIDSRSLPAGQGPNNGSNMGTYPGGFARVGDRVVFGAAVPEGFRELFVMSGPDQASLQEINLEPRAGLDSWPSQAVSAGDVAYVRVSRWQTDGGWEVWRTDGSLLGSYPVAAMGGNSFDLSTTPFEMLPRGGSLFIIPTFGTARGMILRTDGTPASLRTIARAPGQTSDPAGSGLTAWAGGIAFTGTFQQVFVHDPDAGTTRAVTVGGQPLLTDTSGGSGAKLAPQGDGLLSLGRVGNARGLWRIPAGGGEPVALMTFDSGTYSTLFTPAGGPSFVYLHPSTSSSCSLYATDGTTASTRLVWSGVTSSSVLPIIEFAGGVLAAVNSSSGAQIVWSNGDPAATRVVGPLAGVSVSRIWPTDGAFVAMNATGGLWRTDGTPEGTGLISAAAPWIGSQSWIPALSPLTVPAFGGMLFAKQNGSGQSATVDLYFTDGTAEGTRQAADTLPSRVYGTSIGNQAPLPGGRLFFCARTEDEGFEPWVSDGTEAGTRLLADVMPGPADSSVRLLGSDDGQAYFIADDGVTGLELRATDGTPDGLRTFDLTPGATGSFTSSSFPFSGIDVQHAVGASGLLFVGPGGLQRCDGTDVSVVVPVGGGGYSGFKGVTAAPGGGWYAFGLLAGNAKRILALDGTPGGTRTLASFTGTVWAPFVQSGRSLFFGYGPTGQSQGLGVLDLDVPDSARMLTTGAWAPTAALRDGVLAYNNSLHALRFVSRTGEIAELGPYDVPAPAVLGDRAYFFAYTPEHGRELMVTDGTPEGTRVVLDLIPGPFGGMPLGLRTVGDRLYFGALSTDRTHELWTSDGTAEGTHPVWRGDPSNAPRKLVMGGLTASGGRAYYAAERDGVGYQLHSFLLCDADLNADAFIDFDDYITFVDAFEAGSLRADMNSDAFVDFFDYADFVAAFERGC